MHKYNNKTKYTHYSKTNTKKMTTNFENDDDSISEWGDEYIWGECILHNEDEEQNHDLSICFYCDNRTHTTLTCPLSHSQYYCYDTFSLRKKILEKLNTNSITFDELREILTNQLGETTVIKLACDFGYAENTNFQQAIEICMCIFGISTGWFTTRGDQNYIEAASRAWGVRNIELHEKQMERQRNWDFHVRDHRMIPPPLMGQMCDVRYYIHRLYIKFAKLGKLKKFMNVFFFDNYFASPSIQNFINLLGINTPTTFLMEPLSQVQFSLPSTYPIPFDVQGPSFILPPIRRDTFSENVIESKQKRMKKIWNSVEIIQNPIELYDGRQEEPEICPVCVEEIPINKNVITNCRHKLCSDCLVDVFEKCGKRCVTCRADITTIQLETKKQINKFQSVKIRAIM